MGYLIMAAEPKESTVGTERSERFDTTLWSMVRRAGDSQASRSGEALERLCSIYWYPLYVYVRRRGKDPEEALDLTQEFFARLLEKKWLQDANPARGRFRTFLLTAVEGFLNNEWKKSQTAKRGSGRLNKAFDAADAEERFAQEAQENATPDALFDRRWALTLIGRAQDRLRDEEVRSGESARFAALEPTLAGDHTEEGYRELAERFGVTENTVKSWVYRLRKKFRSLLIEEIAQTLDEGQDPNAELSELFAALTR